MSLSIFLIFGYLFGFLYSYKYPKIICNKHLSNNFISDDISKNNIVEDNKYLIKNKNEFNNINQNINSSFNFPELSELFPELKIFFSKHTLKFKECTKDSDCEKYELCCINPLLKGNNFCCSGMFIGKESPSYVY
jgi:hypothetical protein